MTGFGQAQVNSKLCRLSLQLKSVNSRFLDLTLKIPDELAAFEGKLREAITHAVKRGKVEARLSWQTLLPSDGEAEVALINTQALAQILAVQNAILTHAPNASPMSVSALMNAPAVLPSSVGASEVLSAVTADEINELIHTAIAQFKQSRQQEGTHLAQAIFERLDAIGAVVQNLRVQLPELLKHQEAKLTERLLKALDNDKNEVKLATSAIPREELIERIRQETSLTAIRIDVAEELDRLDGHLANARQCFVDGGNVGKKLDFLMQEFNREANTLGSKSASLLQTQASLDLKLMIEQMREQVQNLE
ncbi:MAG: YicC family protein [Burkholderiales bacterium]|nr:YicC family protein [Burkholderiales bacterium]